MIKCSDQHHAALKLDADAWRRLELVGTQPAYDPDRPDLRLELRNCLACGSTIAVEIHAETVQP
jgi:hypothetical protein